MATTAKRPTRKAAIALPENRTPSEVLAHEILVEYSDLAPSVNKIMQADALGEDGRLQALTLFRGALGVAGDPMRNPANAIAAAS